MLLGAGADVGAADRSGWTPLHFAAYGGKLETVKYLVEEGAVVNARDNRGRTPRPLAVEKGRTAVVAYFDTL